MSTRHVAAEDGGRTYLTQAVPVIGWEPDDVAWLAARRDGIGASEIASVAQVPGAFSSPFALWWAKRLGWDTERTFAMKVGTALEPIIGQLFMDEYPGVRLVRPAARLYRHPEWSWMLASPDFLAVEGCGLCMGTGLYGIDPSSDTPAATCQNCAGEGGWVEPVECKSDEGRKWVEPPPKHQLQTAQQMLVFGSARGHLVRLSGKKLSAYLIDEDTAMTDTIMSAGAWFADCMATGTAPALDGSDATEAALQRLFPPGDYPDEDPAAERVLPVELIGEFMAAHEKRQRALERFALARNRVRAAMLDARYGVGPDGARVIEHRKYKKGAYQVGAAEVDEIRKAW